MKKNSEENRPWYLDTIERCKMMYCGVNKPITESLIPFGFECGSGWKRPLDDLSDAIESMNITYYPKYKVRYEAVQIKEKFGTLRVYGDVVIDLPWYCTFLGTPFKAIADILKYKINYKMVYVKDEQDHDEIEESELKDITNDQEFEEYKNKHNWYRTTYEKKNGKYYKYQTITHVGKSHYEPSTYKSLYKLFHILYKISSSLTWYKEPTREQEVIRNAIDITAERLIRMAEQECYNICEDCGSQIGTDWSPRCRTTGWIKYICEHCAEKHENNYIKGDSLYHKGEFVKKIEKHEEM